MPWQTSASEGCWPLYLDWCQATGRDPDLPDRFTTIMQAERHVTDLPNDVDVVKDFIAAND